MEHDDQLSATVAVKARGLNSTGGGLRKSEKVLAGFLIYAAVASLFFTLPWSTRAVVWCLNALIVCVFFMYKRALDLPLKRKAYTAQGKTSFTTLIGVLRNWIPAALIVAAYRESGLFYVPDRTHHWDLLFERWDSVLLHSSLVKGILAFGSPWLGEYLELAYLLCYPVVPLGLLAVYIVYRCGASRSRAPGLAVYKPRGGGAAFDLAADRFWTTVLLSVLTAYALFPLFPSVTPRLLFHDFPGPPPSHLLRDLNLAILGRYGIVVSVFPSGHVAGVTSTALAVYAESRRAGAIFLIVAASIAAATVYGRYHYTADAVAGASIAIAAYGVSRWLHSS